MAIIMIIIAAGDIDKYFLKKYVKDQTIICADSGYDTAIAAGLQPNIVIGDMDSVQNQIQTQTLKFPTDKDKTDLHIAIDYALEQGAKEITMLGALGGEIGHTLANVLLLKYIADYNAKGTIVNENSELHLIKNYIEFYDYQSKKLSLIPLTPTACVSIEGVKFPLTNATINIADTFSVSNIINHDHAKVTVHDGEVFVAID